MDFVSVRDLRIQPGEVWKKLAKQHDLVITRNGKPFAILTETSPTGLHDDINALHKARFGKALDAARATAEQAGVADMSMEEILAEIDEARRERKAAASS
jgi:hypothetical protein